MSRPASESNRVRITNNTRAMSLVAAMTGAGLLLSLLLLTQSALAFSVTDAAGIRGVDTVSGGPTIADFVHLETTCGATCKKTLNDETTLNVCPPAGSANSWTFRWSSAVASVYNGALSCSSTNRLVAAHSNGFISFAAGAPCSGAACYSSTNIPATSLPNSAIYAAWHDLYPSAPFGVPGAVYVQAQGTAPNRVMIIEYLNVPWACWQDGAETFEFKLFEANNHVEVIYLNQIPGTIDGACAPYQYVRGGEENSAGTAGMQYFGGTGIYSPPSNLGISYTDVVPPLVNLPTVACSVAGLNGWCRSLGNTITIVDSDLGTTVTGLGVGTRQLLVDGAATGSYASGAAFSLTSGEGIHTVQGRATDWANNVGTSAAKTFSIDATPPTVAIDLACTLNGDGACVDPAHLTPFAADAVSGIATIACTLDGSAISCADGQVNNVNVGGDHQFGVTVTDVAGNTATASRAFRVILDAIPPVVSLSVHCTLGNAEWCLEVARVVATATDESGIASLACTLDGAPRPCANGVEQSIDGLGVHTLSATAVDTAGNAASSSVAFKIDNAPPVVSFASDCAHPGNAGWCRAASITYDLTSSDAGSGLDTVTCTVDGAAAACAGALAGEGVHTLAAHAVDVAGNRADASLQVSLDSIAPVLSFSTTCALPGSAGWCRSDIAVQVFGSDATSGLASISCTSGGTPQSCDQLDVTTEGPRSLSALGTDAAGNSATASVDVLRDATPPLLIAARSPPANPAGWNNGPVTASWTCTDALSGVETVSPAFLLDGEGAGQATTGTCSDLAGNLASASVTGVNIDLTAPHIDLLSRLPEANGHGWNRGPVSITWTCSDALSGAEAPSITQTLTGEGADQSVSGACADLAGNTATASEGPINIDLSGPFVALLSQSPPANVHGWNHAPVTVTWSCGDHGSGVVAEAVATTLASEGGNQAATAVCTDLAGNTAMGIATGIRIDLTPPTLTGSFSPGLNAMGWTNQQVALHWGCSDALAGIDEVSADELLAADGADQGAHGTCTDLAGNTAEASLAGINIDRTAPVIALASRTAANPHGWNAGPVALTWTCHDDLSGALQDLVGAVIDAEGADQSASQTCADLAGNTATDAQGGLRIDLTPPVITGRASPAANAHGWNNAPVTISFECVDALAGVEAVSGPVVLGSEGRNLGASGTCSDLAGNTADAAVAGILLDLTPPTISGSRAPAANAAGWNAGPVAALFACDDALAGVDLATAPTPIVLSQEGGNQAAAGSCADLAGNTAEASLGGINIDLTPPVLTPSLSGSPGKHGWWRSSVTLRLTCSDVLSGLGALPLSHAENGGAYAAYVAPVILASEGRTSVATRCVDQAGNAAAGAQDVRIDSLAPLGNVGSPLLAAGAYDVAWASADATSGLASVRVEERPLVGDLLGQVFAAVCTRDVSGTEASGACHRDPAPNAYCYRIVIEDEAGNVYTSPSIGLELGATPNFNELAVLLRTTCTVKVLPQTTATAAALGLGNCASGQSGLACAIQRDLATRLRQVPLAIPPAKSGPLAIA